MDIILFITYTGNTTEMEVLFTKVHHHHYKH